MLAEQQPETLDANQFRQNSPLHYKKFYRERERRRIIAALQSGSSLIVLGECGVGKTVLADAVVKDLRHAGFAVALVLPSTEKVVLTRVCQQFLIDTETLEGKSLTIAQMKDAIAEFVSRNPVFFICDNAHSLPKAVRLWLAELHDMGQPLLLLILKRPNESAFIKAPMIELEGFGYKQIREVMLETCEQLGAQLNNYQLAYLQQRCAGNPMLARKAVREEFLGVDETEPDHTRWFNGLPLLIAFVMTLTLIRFIGKGTDDRTLIIIGGCLTVAIGIFRLLAMSMEKRSKGVGR